MANFPPEIITDIICRLPVKDLLRYRCVSKSWRSMIDGPDFIKLHSKQSMESQFQPQPRTNRFQGTGLY
ncbi:hypothetical protein TIFTF001_006070 [Ficus carica]|uniref:F-box domain-containing protein n=1 Tax=Ficus carica TaxID=3494 RepID=A0AA88A3C5_FICCA|nr:hypothetical protein TIFTF001_006070 [Ficus carica]